jgi:hypothetical protein
MPRSGSKETSALQYVGKNAAATGENTYSLGEEKLYA